MKRALVVDDDESIRFALRMVLEEEGYAIEEAANGVEALAFLEQAAESRLVLLDFMMPRMDGATVLRIVAATPTLRNKHAFILVTARNRHSFPELDDILKALEVVVVEKPFDIDSILTTIEMASQRLRGEDDDEVQRPITGESDSHSSNIG